MSGIIIACSACGVGAPVRLCEGSVAWMTKVNTFSLFPYKGNPVMQRGREI